jgi:hypothetical protein
MRPALTTRGDCEPSWKIGSLADESPPVPVQFRHCRYLSTTVVTLA